MNHKGSAVVIVLVAVIVLLIGGGIWYYETHQPVSYQTQSAQNRTNTQAVSSSSAPTDTITLGPLADTSGWKTYTDPQGKYEFSYPPNWINVTSPDNTLPSPFIDSNRTISASFELPVSAYPNTDFATADFSVNTDNKISPGDCIKFWSDGDGLSSTQTITSATTTVLDGVTFYQYSNVGGPSYGGSDIGYNGVVGNTCYGLIQGLHNNDNYQPQPTITHKLTNADWATIQQQLNTILSTVKFL